MDGDLRPVEERVLEAATPVTGRPWAGQGEALMIAAGRWAVKHSVLINV